MKSIYVDVRKPLIFKEFERFKAPMGWYRIDLLQKKLESDKAFRLKFTDDEIKEIMVVKL